MIRCNNNIFFDTTSNLNTHNPLLPAGTIIANIETGQLRTSDGIHRYADLPSSVILTIGGKNIQSGGPFNDSTLYYNGNTLLWEFATRGIVDTMANIEGDPTIFPTYAVILEVDISGVSTGRVKIADGKSTCSNLPWLNGINVYGEFATGIIGSSIEWDGCQWIPVEYVTNFAPVTPTGKILFDDMTWGNITSLPALESLTSEIGVFETVYVGSSPIEENSVTLTSNGESLFVDSQKVWTQYNDGHGSGMDADTLDGYHAADFATRAEMEQYTVTEDDVLAYSIAFGG